MKKTVSISQLFVYPVKSLPGLSVSSLVLDRLGAVDDRRYMLVDENGKFMSQRQDAALALIRLERHPEGWLLVGRDSSVQRFLPRAGTTGHPVTVTIWNDTCQAFDQGDEWAAWFGQQVGKPARLVYTPPGIARRIDAKYCADERHVSFSDGYPLLVVSESSLALLNSHLASPVEVRRFRPNVVVQGSAAFTEDSWKVLKSSGNELALVKPCSRCVIPTINPATGEKEKEVWQVLEKLRKAADGKIYFGQNAIHRQPGLLAVGDVLEVIEGY